MSKQNIFDAALVNNEVVIAEKARLAGDIVTAITHIEAAIHIPCRRCVRDWLYLAKDALRKEAGEDVIAPATFQLCVNSMRNVLYV